MLIEGAIGLVGSVLGALASALAIWSYVRRPVAALEEKIERLERDRLDRLDKQAATAAAKLEQHIGADQGLRILTVLEQLQTTVSRISAKLDKLCEDAARQDAEIKANAKYIANLDASFERHKETTHHGN